MEQIRELVTMAQQIDAMMDDLGGAVYMLDINSKGKCSYLIETEVFLEEFEQAELKRRNDSEVPFELETQIEGVTFKAFVHVSEVDLLKNKKSPIALACEDGQIEQIFSSNYV